MSQINYICPGLLTTTFPDNLKKCLIDILKAIGKEKKSFSERGIPFTDLQTKNGGRRSTIFPFALATNKFPKFFSPEANEAMEKIVSFKEKIFNILVKKHCGQLEKEEYRHCVSFHIYEENQDNELGFEPHIDFGTIAIVFTMGKDFEFSRNQGQTWEKISDVSDDTVIINFGRIFSTFSGIDPVYHRVSAVGSLEKEGFPGIAKFTVGFFQELAPDIKIPDFIPEHIDGKHRENWEFLIKNCKKMSDYNEGRINGTIKEDTDGKLFI